MCAGRPEYSATGSCQFQWQLPSGSCQFQWQLPVPLPVPLSAASSTEPVCLPACKQLLERKPMRVTVLLVHRGRSIIIIIIITIMNAILNHPGCCNVSSSGGCNETEDELFAAETGARLLRIRPQKLWTRLCLRNLKSILSLLLLVTRMC